MVAQIGKPAPEFTAAAYANGEITEVSLRDYKGKWVVLFFYPLDFTFVCPTEIQGFDQKKAEFDKLNAQILGASVDSARLAAEKGWQLVFAGHLNGDPENLRETFEVYRRESGRSAILTLAAFVAEDETQARERVSGMRIFKVFLSNGQTVNVGSEEQAAEFARQSGITEYRVEEKAPGILHGTAAQVRKELDALHHQHGISEFIIETPALTAAERFASIELLAKERLSLAA